MQKIARPGEVVAQMREGVARPVDQMLSELFNNFILAARAIDSSITGQWVGTAVQLDGTPALPSYVMFERHDSQIVRPARAAIETFQPHQNGEDG